MRRNKNRYNIMANVVLDDEVQNHTAITHIMCKRKMKRYLRILMKYKANNFKLNFIHVFRCDFNGKMIDNEYIRFITSKRSINKIY